MQAVKGSVTHQGLYFPRDECKPEGTHSVCKVTAEGQQGLRKDLSTTDWSRRDLSDHRIWVFYCTKNGIWKRDTLG